MRNQTIIVPHDHRDFDTVGAAVAMSREYPGALRAPTRGEMPRPRTRAQEATVAEFVAIRKATDADLDLAQFVVVDHDGSRNEWFAARGPPAVAVRIIDHHVGSEHADACSACEVIASGAFESSTTLSCVSAAALLVGMLSDSDNLRRISYYTPTALSAILAADWPYEGEMSRIVSEARAATETVSMTDRAARAKLILRAAIRENVAIVGNPECDQGRQLGAALSELVMTGGDVMLAVGMTRFPSGEQRMLFRSQSGSGLALQAATAFGGGGHADAAGAPWHHDPPPSTSDYIAYISDALAVLVGAQ